MNKPLTAKNINGPHKHKKMISLALLREMQRKTFKCYFLLSRLENIYSSIISSIINYVGN